MSVIQLDPARSRLSAVLHVVWRSVQVAAGVLDVVVPFGYAVTPMHVAVLMAAGSAFAVGVGLSLRMGDRGGRPAGILVGSTVGNGSRHRLLQSRSRRTTVRSSTSLADHRVTRRDGDGGSGRDAGRERSGDPWSF